MFGSIYSTGTGPLSGPDAVTPAGLVPAEAGTNPPSGRSLLAVFVHADDKSCGLGAAPTWPSAR